MPQIHTLLCFGIEMCVDYLFRITDYSKIWIVCNDYNLSVVFCFSEAMNQDIVCCLVIKVFFRLINH